MSVVLLFTATRAARADVRIDKSDASVITVHLNGTISERDAKAIQELSHEVEFRQLLLILDSRGGDVTAAMDIGRFVRKYDGVTEVYNKCYSSCALIFISGVTRNLLGRGELGLHRPYFASAPQSRETLEKQVPLMLSMVRRYIAEMGIGDNFYQQMVNTEPSQMIVYRDDS